MSGITRAPVAEWSFAEHEHRELVRGINRIHDVGCAIGSRTRADVSTNLLEILRWYDRDLSPHMRWEESWLYPEIEARTDAAWATRSATFDHGQIAAVIGRIRDDHATLARGGDRALLDEIRCHLFSLEALVRSHIEREERLLIRCSRHHLQHDHAAG